jgi:hypothetical protein
MAIEQYRLEGLSELVEALNELPIELQAKILKSFISKAGRKFIVDELKKEVRTTLHTRKGETLNQSDFINVVTDPENKELAIKAGITSKGYKLRWLSLGTKERQTNKGANRGRIIGDNKIQPLIESQIEPIVNYTNENLGDEIDKILQRRLKKLRSK